MCLAGGRVLNYGAVQIRYEIGKVAVSVVGKPQLSKQIPTWDEWDPDQDRWYYDWKQYAAGGKQ